MVNVLKESMNVEYYAVPGRGHCDLTDEMRELYEKKIAEAF
jgi:hypothetical protein